MRTIDLPAGQDYAFFPDLNIIALGSHLDDAGRCRAIDELQCKWRRENIRAV